MNSPFLDPNRTRSPMPLVAGSFSLPIAEGGDPVDSQGNSSDSDEEMEEAETASGAPPSLQEVEGDDKWEDPILAVENPIEEEKEKIPSGKVGSFNGNPSGKAAACTCSGNPPLMQQIPIKGTGKETDPSRKMDSWAETMTAPTSRNPMGTMNLLDITRTETDILEAAMKKNSP